jgi:small GTP-binding protein
MTDTSPKTSTTSNTSSETASKSETEYKFEILPEDYTNFDLSFKLIVIGDSGVGKSCLTNNAIKNTFDEAYNATVGFEFTTFNIKINDKVVKLQIWDTCGQELYRSLITNFYRNSSLAIIVYAINSKDSFDNIEMWLRELRTHSNPDVKIFLIGNKVDLEKRREVTKEEGEKLCKDNNIHEFMESSAKTGINTQKIFIKAAQKLYEDYITYQKKAESSGTGSAQINNNFEQKPDDRKKIDNKPVKKQGGCC